MNHVRVTTVTGHEVDIPHEEALRIAQSMHPQKTLDNFHEAVKLHNEHYHKKAAENIKEIAARNGFVNFNGSEEEYKELISCMLDEDFDIGDLIVEIVEERISAHHKEIYSE